MPPETTSSPPMKSTLRLLILALGLAATAFAADSKPAPSPDAALIEKARASYPLKTCLVSDEALGSMGEATGYVHRVAGQPDRVVFFCCDGCMDDFKKEPAKFLAKVDAAAKAKNPPFFTPPPPRFPTAQPSPAAPFLRPAHASSSKKFIPA
eukprot:gene3594-4620_t